MSVTRSSRCDASRSAGQTEVDQAHAPGLVGKHVAGMRIAVEEAVDEHLLHGRVDELLDHVPCLGAVRLEGAQRAAGEELHRQHGAAAELVERPRHDDGAGRIEQRARRFQVLELGGEVELAQQALLELGDDLRHGGQLHLVDRRLQRARGEVEEIEVAAQDALDARPLHLDHQRRAVEGGGAVRLRDRRRAQRPFVDVGEQLPPAAGRAPPR